MNRFLFFGGLVVLLIASLISIKTTEEYKVSHSGKIVNVVILRLPRCTGYKNNFIRFEYKQQNYIQRVKCKYVKGLKRGDTIEMLHIEGSSTFLFKEENIYPDAISNLMIALAGIAIMIVSLWKK